MNEVETANPQPSERYSSQSQRLRELALLFLKLGAISFGGPAAHVALIESEIVQKRQWLTRQQFLDMLGAANLIPGPTSTEVAINTGYTRAGWTGLCVAGISFILPAACITAVFAWAYVRFGTLPQTAFVLAGIKPAVIAVIAMAIWRLGKAAVKDVGLATLGGLSLAAFFLGANPIAILFGGGGIGMLGRRAGTFRRAVSCFLPALSVRGLLSYPFGVGTFAFVSATVATNSTKPSAARMFLFFVKVGAVLFGGGYVLLAFLEHGLVQQYAWMTRQQLLDAVAIGQFTPGPVLSTATFIGYILGGIPGAVVATLGIFLPSFFYVALLAPILFRLRKSLWIGAFLDSVNACAVVLMAGVTLQLAADALRGWMSWLIALFALGVLLRWKVSPAWIVLGGGISGLLLEFVR